MATVTGKTSLKIDDLVNASIISGYINGAGHLILVNRGGAEQDAGPIARSVGNPWSGAISYADGDVVGYAGAVWRAKIANVNKVPGLFTSVWTRLEGRDQDGWPEKDPFFDGDDVTESWDFGTKTGAPIKSLTNSAGEFETGIHALKLSLAAGEAQTFFQKEENIVRGGDVYTVTVRARLVTASAGTKLQTKILQNDATGSPIPGASGLTSTAATEGDATLTTAFATYTFTLNAVNAKPRAAITLNVFTAATAALVCVDWVRITRKKTTPLDSYPIGAVYIGVSNTNPSSLFGGTWVAFGTGRTLVGVDVSQTEFDSVEETGGEKTHTLTIAETPSHSHAFTALAVSATGGASGGTTENGSGAVVQGPATSRFIHPITIQAPTALTTSGSDGAHNNLQPYITVYMFKRTA